MWVILASSTFTIALTWVFGYVCYMAGVMRERNRLMSRGFCRHCPQGSDGEQG